MLARSYSNKRSRLDGLPAKFFISMGLRSERSAVRVSVSVGTKNERLAETDRTFRNISKPYCITFSPPFVSALKQATQHRPVRRYYIWFNYFRNNYHEIWCSTLKNYVYIRVNHWAFRSSLMQTNKPTHANQNKTKQTEPRNQQEKETTKYKFRPAFKRWYCSDMSLRDLKIRWIFFPFHATVFSYRLALFLPFHGSNRAIFEIPSGTRHWWKRK